MKEAKASKTIELCVSCSNVTASGDLLERLICFGQFEGGKNICQVQFWILNQTWAFCSLLQVTTNFDHRRLTLAWYARCHWSISFSSSANIEKNFIFGVRFISSLETKQSSQIKSANEQMAELKPPEMAKLSSVVMKSNLILFSLLKRMKEESESGGSNSKLLFLSSRLQLKLSRKKSFLWLHLTSFTWTSQQQASLVQVRLVPVKFRNLKKQKDFP